MAALATTLGGIDALVFTGGIGEHQPEIGDRICRRLDWLGIRVDGEADVGRHPSVLVIPTDEEQVVADEGATLLSHRG